MLKMICLVAVTVLYANCVSTFYISKEDFLQQIKTENNKTLMFIRNDSLITQNAQGKDVRPPAHFRQEMRYLKGDTTTLSIYSTKRMKTIDCYTRQGEKVRLKIDKNVVFQIYSSIGRKTSIYFYPVDIVNSIFIGYRSRLLRINKVIDLDSIHTIKLHAEFPVVY